MARRRSEPCELPNTVLALVQGASGGVLRVRFSPSGLFLAMVYAEAEVTRVSVHTGITGEDSDSGVVEIPTRNSLKLLVNYVLLPKFVHK